MYQQYDRAVQDVLDYLKDNGYSMTPTKDFRRAAQNSELFCRYQIKCIHQRRKMRGFAVWNIRFHECDILRVGGLSP